MKRKIAGWAFCLLVAAFIAYKFVFGPGTRMSPREIEWSDTGNFYVIVETDSEMVRLAKVSSYYSGRGGSYTVRERDIWSDWYVKKEPVLKNLNVQSVVKVFQQNGKVVVDSSTENEVLLTLRADYSSIY